MKTGECCCLVGTNLRMYGLMTKLTLSLLEYIILLFEYYISHCILDEVVHPAPPPNCSSFAPAAAAGRPAAWAKKHDSTPG